MNSPQAPSSVLMVRPASFGFNPQTAASNVFQTDRVGANNDISKLAMAEFDRMVHTMRENGIHVIVADDTSNPIKPDAVFPNNWISFHPDGTVILYPMMAENRRLERNSNVLPLIKSKFQVSRLLDFSDREMENQFLEGTGSIVFDYPNKIAYACRSARTHDKVFHDLCDAIGYRGILFDAVDELGTPIYHTNVLMCVGTRFVVVCLDAVKGDQDQGNILQSFQKTNHQIVAISYAQLRSFAGNMIEVRTQSNEAVVLISQRAYDGLLPLQLDVIGQNLKIIPLQISTIEQFGGGSVRCMVAGIFNMKVS